MHSFGLYLDSLTFLNIWQSRISPGSLSLPLRSSSLFSSFVARLQFILVTQTQS